VASITSFSPRAALTHMLLCFRGRLLNPFTSLLILRFGRHIDACPSGPPLCFDPCPGASYFHRGRAARHRFWGGLGLLFSPPFWDSMFPFFFSMLWSTPRFFLASFNCHPLTLHGYGPFLGSLPTHPSHTKFAFARCPALHSALFFIRRLVDPPSYFPKVDMPFLPVAPTHFAIGDDKKKQRVWPLDPIFFRGDGFFVFFPLFPPPPNPRPLCRLLSCRMGFFVVPSGAQGCLRPFFLSFASFRQEATSIRSLLSPQYSLFILPDLPGLKILLWPRPPAFTPRDGNYV